MSLSNKKALSNMVGYVLLIVITISLSIIVYAWIKSYVMAEETKTCPENINIVIESYTCTGNNLQVTLKNKGFFKADGYILRVHNRTDAAFGLYVLDDTGTPLSPGQEYNETYDFSSQVSTVRLVDVQPFLNDSGTKVSCQGYASQKVTCS